MRNFIRPALGLLLKGKRLQNPVPVKYVQAGSGLILAIAGPLSALLEKYTGLVIAPEDAAGLLSLALSPEASAYGLFIAIATLITSNKVGLPSKDG